MIFVSYSRSDIATTRAVVESLSAKGVECWLDEMNIPVGQAFVERLGAALRNANGLLLVDTMASRTSYWVSRELQTSSRYRRDGRYHSALRVYAADCKHAEVADWDLSVPLDRLSASQIADFLASRSIVHGTSNLASEVGGISFINSTGLGQPVNWTGRQDELRILDAWWFGPSPGVWLRGMGGSGKSGLLQTWITALSHFGYGEPVSATALCLRGSQSDVADAQRALFTREPRTASSRSLLLLDGYDEARRTRDVEEVILEALHLGVRVLVTSRSAVPSRLARHFTNLNLGTMTRRDSVAVLNQFGVIGPESEQLAAELGDLPLALFILAQFSVARERTAAELLADLHHAQNRMPGSISRVSLSVRTLLGNSIKGLTSDAKSLLVALCQSPEDSAAPTVLAQPAIRELANAGLVQVDHFEMPHQLSIHPLLRDFVREVQGGSG